MILQMRRRDDTVHIISAGRVVKGAEIKETKNGKEKVKFSFAYADKEYMNVEAWGDSSVGQAAATLEKGDQVIVAGIVRSWEYEGKTYSTLDADFVASQEALLQALFQQEPASSAPRAQSGGKPDANGETDGGWEELEGSDDELPF